MPVCKLRCLNKCVFTRVVHFCSYLFTSLLFVPSKTFLSISLKLDTKNIIVVYYKSILVSALIIPLATMHLATMHANVLLG